MINTFLEKTRAGRFTIGTFFEFGQASAAEIMGLSDLDYFIIDCEHGPYDVESAAEIIRAAEGVSGCRVTPFARARDSTRPSILKLLDIGAKGIIIPDVHSLDEARRIVEYGKYAPVGRRGVAVSRSVRFGFDKNTADTTNIDEWFRECNEKELLIPQCETTGCLEAIEDIAALDGIDGIFVGPYDLSTAMGIPAQFDRPEFTDALLRIIRAVKAADKFAICYVESAALASRRRAMGYDSVTMGMDSSIYYNALNHVAADVNRACGSDFHK